MNMLIAVGATALLWEAWRRYCPHHPSLALVDAPSVSAVVELIERLERKGGADALATRVTNLLRRFPPDEATLRRLSTFQQHLEGSGTRAEYAVTCMYVLANEVVASGHHRPERSTMRQCATL